MTTYETQITQLLNLLEGWREDLSEVPDTDLEAILYETQITQLLNLLEGWREDLSEVPDTDLEAILEESGRLAQAIRYEMERRETEGDDDEEETDDED